MCGNPRGDKGLLEGGTLAKKKREGGVGLIRFSAIAGRTFGGTLTQSQAPDQGATQWLPNPRLPVRRFTGGRDVFRTTVKETWH